MQNSRTITDSIALVRAIPDQDWLSRRDRTSVDFSSTYGRVSQPNTPTLKTSIYHADADRDAYFSPVVFGFGQAEFDHNYSQGFDLQQTYAGGIGWSVFRNPKEGLDLKGGMSDFHAGTFVQPRVDANEGVVCVWQRVARRAGL